MFLRLLIVSVLFLSLWGDEFEDELAGFEDDSISISELENDINKTEKESWLDITGDFSFLTAYNYAHKKPQKNKTDFRGISRAKEKLGLVFDMKLSENIKSKVELKAFYDEIFDLKNNNHYTKEIRDELEFEYEIKEAYIQGSLSSNLDFKLGRQIVVFGKSDNIRITDVINPLDNREMGMVDIEDLKLPVGMSKFDYYFDKWSISTIIINEARVQKEAPYGSDYLPTDIFPKSFKFPDDETPESNIKNTQYAIALDGRLSGWDISFYIAKVLNNKWNFENNKKIRRYNPIIMNGLAFNMVFGSWVIKSEAAFLKDLRYNTTVDKKERLDTLIGAEYNGINDLVVSLEIANRHIYKYENKMSLVPDLAHKDEQQSAFRISYKFDHDKGTATYLRSILSSNNKTNGGFQRGWVEYNLVDDLKVNGGVVDYIGGENRVLEALSNNDRIFGEFKYSF